MPQVIWKVRLEETFAQDIYIPQHAELLTAREQQGHLCVWIKCDRDQPLTKRHIVVCRTGDVAPQDARYVGTGILAEGSFVLHVFESMPQ